ncbi:MAG TPA: hypothetical protein VGZ29_05610 [Terriglobia bacterium]|nr:hypothetical protein [Terriglobia bacterium]
MSEVQLDQIPEHCRLTVLQAQEFEKISRRELYNRLTEGGSLDWSLAPNPGRGPKEIKVVDARSLSRPEAHQRFLRSIARERMESSEFFGAQSPAAPSDSNIHLTGAGGDASDPLSERGGRTPSSEPGTHQGDLFLSPVAERLPGEYEQKRIAERRLKLVEPVGNGLYRRLGFATKGDYLRATASAHKTSVRSLQRWWDDYRRAGGGVQGLRALMTDKPGPEATGPRLEAWQKHFLDEERLLNHSTRERAYERLIAETGSRQASWGVAHIYQQPTRSAVYRYWASLGEQAPMAAAIEGRSALKAAAMQISRTYADCSSLDRVGVDEWITDVFTYNPARLLKDGKPRVGRAYLVTMLDERSLYPLEAVIAEFPSIEDEIDLLVSVSMQYGVPGLINSDRGRMRGKTFGGQFREFDRDKARSRTDGILDRLGVGRNMPREHNPQGNRLERFHLELARFAKTLPGWCGNSPEERDEFSNAEAAIRQHERWVRGGDGAPATTPLLSQDELLEKVRGFFAWWRNEHYSEGTDMNGLTPQMVFDRNRPAEGFRKVSLELLDAATARVWTNHLVKAGGVIEISEGNYQTTRYYSHELVLIQGERRTVTRSRYDRSKVTVHGIGPEDPAIIAPAQTRVGVSDPELLGQAIAEKEFSRNLLRTALERPAREISSSEVMTGGLSAIRPPRSRDRVEGEMLQPVTSEDVARRALERLMEMEEQAQ